MYVNFYVFQNSLKTKIKQSKKKKKKKNYHLLFFAVFISFKIWMMLDMAVDDKTG